MIDRKSHETFRLNKELAAVKAHCVKVQNELTNVYKTKNQELPTYLETNLDLAKNYDIS